MGGKQSSANIFIEQGIIKQDKKGFDYELEIAHNIIVPILRQLFYGGFKQRPLEYFILVSQEQVSGSICGVRINQFSSEKIVSYKCYTCQIHPDSILCDACFKKGNHKGHRYVYYTDIDGICDCGNESIIKTQGFCSDHSKSQFREAKQLLINVKNCEDNYINIISKSLQWALSHHWHQLKVYSQILLRELLVFLIKANQKNSYYWKQNKQIFFENNGSSALLIDRLIDFQCKDEQEFQQSQICKFISTLFSSSELLHFLFQAFLNAYSRNHKFPKSKFFNHLKHLACQPSVVSDAYKNNRNLSNPQGHYTFTLKYTQVYNYLLYYEHLYELIEVMDPELAYHFIRPFIYTQIPYRYMMKQYADKFDNMCQTEHLYYRLMCKIISLIKKKQELQIMMATYFKMYKRNLKGSIDSFRIPQRVLAIIIFQYADCNLQNLFNCKIQILIKEQGQFVKIFQQIFRQLVNLCKTLSYRYGYQHNWPYKKYYVKNNIIKYDILMIQILSKLLTRKYTAFLIHDFILVTIKDEDMLALKLFPLTRMMLRMNILILLGEIQTSRISELYFGLIIRKNDQHINQLAKTTLKALFSTQKEIKLKQFQKINKFFFGNNLSKEIIEQVAIFNKKKQMYRAKDPQGDHFNFNLHISISTQFQQFYNETNHSKTIKYPFQQRNPSSIFSEQIVTSTLQLIISGFYPQIYQKDYLLHKMILTNKILKIIYPLSEQYNNNVDKIKRLLISACLSYYQSQQLEEHYPEFYHKLIQSQFDGKSLNKQDNQLQKRKQRQKLKRMALISQKKIKQQQYMYSNQKQEMTIQDEYTNLCHVCKLPGNLCYLAELNYTNLLFHRFHLQGENITIRTCKHTIHYECFLTVKQDQTEIACPLCRQPTNTVIPMDLQNKQLMSVLWTYYEFLIEEIKQMKKNLREQFLLYICYMLFMNQEFECDISKDDQVIIHFILTLCNHQKASHPQQDPNFLSQIIKTTKYSNKRSKDHVIRYITLLMKIYNSNYTKSQLTQFINERQISSNILQTWRRINKFTQSFEERAQIDKQAVQQQHIIALQNEQQKSQQVQIEQVEQDSNDQFEMSRTKLPKKLNQFLQIRDSQIIINKQQMHPFICNICSMQYGSKQTSNYCTKTYGQCLLINTIDATLMFNKEKRKWLLFNIYQNQDEETWNISKEIDQFRLNQTKYKKILKALILKDQNTITQESHF